MRNAILAGLVVIASVVTGAEAPLPATAVADENTVPAPAAPLVPVRLPPTSTGEDLFGAFAPPAPPAPAKPIPAEQPAVATPAPPPLPFTYLGRMRRRDTTIVYVLRNQEMVVATPGSTLDSTYRVESISDTAMTLVYLPLGISQTLSLPPER